MRSTVFTAGREDSIQAPYPTTRSEASAGGARRRAGSRAPERVFLRPATLQASVRKPRILLVDDSDTVLTMERMLLSEEAYDLLLARDGGEAVERAIAERPDLILMDIVMPRMDGLEACRRLRQHEATKDIPIIMVTTRGEAESVEAGYASGCTDYVTKPIDGLELLTKLRSYLAVPDAP
jgi:CheY-like chemotaxis protein